MPCARSGVVVCRRRACRRQRRVFSGIPAPRIRPEAVFCRPSTPVTLHSCRVVGHLSPRYAAARPTPRNVVLYRVARCLFAEDSTPRANAPRMLPAPAAHEALPSSRVVAESLRRHTARAASSRPSPLSSFYRLPLPRRRGFVAMFKDAACRQRCFARCRCSPPPPPRPLRSVCTFVLPRRRPAVFRRQPAVGAMAAV